MLFILNRLAGMIVDCNCLRATTGFDSRWLKSERYWVIKAHEYISDCGSVDEGSISGGVSEPSWSDSSAPLSSASPSETTRPIC